MRDFEACFGVAVFCAPSVIVQSNTNSAADKAPSVVGIATLPASTVAASALAQEVGSCLPIRAMRCRTEWNVALPLTSRYSVFRPGAARFLFARNRDGGSNLPVFENEFYPGKGILF